jgi:ribonuclease HI
MRTTPTNAMEALVGLPPLDLVVQGEARASAHRLWSLGSWSHLHPNSCHSTILVQLHQSDPIFNMRADVMRPEYNFEPKYRVELLSRKDWTIGMGTPPIVKGQVWFTDGSHMEGRTGAGVYGQSNGRRLSLPLGQYATVFQAKVYTILACAHDIAAHGVPGKYVSICSDSQAALKAIRAVRTTSPLVRQCQEAENISTWHAVGLYWVPGHAGMRGNETADGLTRNGSASDFVGPEPALGISRQDFRTRINRWLENQHQRRWWNLGGSQRRIMLFSLTRAQTRVVTGLLTGHNTLRRHLHLMGLTDSPQCRKCGAKDETSAHIHCRCEALVSIRQAHLGSFVLEPENVKSQTLAAIWRFSKAAGFP